MLSGQTDSAVLIIDLKRSHSVKAEGRVHVMRPQNLGVVSFRKLHPTDKKTAVGKEREGSVNLKNGYRKLNKIPSMKTKNDRQHMTFGSNVLKLN